MSALLHVFDGSYEAWRAAALAGVPLSTVYDWARKGVVVPSVSQVRQKLWSYADLMALRIVYWLRHPKEDDAGEVAASPMAEVRTSDCPIWETVNWFWRFTGPARDPHPVDAWEYFTPAASHVGLRFR